MSASRRARLEASRGESESLVPYAIGAAALAAIGVGVWYFLRSRPQQPEVRESTDAKRGKPTSAARRKAAAAPAPSKKKITKEELMSMIKPYMEKEDVAGAIKKLDTILKKDPACREAVIFKARLLWAIGQVEQAQRTLEEGEKAMEGDEEELRLMCVDEVMLLLNFGEAEQACQLASAAHEQYPTDTTLALMYANLMAMVGNPDLAEAALKGVLKRNPLHFEALMTLISIFDQTERSAEALEMFKQAETAAQQGDPASLKGRRATIASVKASVFKSLKRYDDALTSIDAAIALLSKENIEERAGLLLRKGEYLAAFGRAPEAVEVWRGLLTLAPKHPRVRECLAIAGLVHGQGTVQDALKLLETELELGEDASPSARYWRLWALVRNGEFAAAIGFCDEMVAPALAASEQGNTPPQKLLAELLILKAIAGFQQSNKTPGQAALGLALRINPKFELALQMQEMVKAGAAPEAFLPLLEKTLPVLRQKGLAPELQEDEDEEDGEGEEQAGFEEGAEEDDEASHEDQQLNTVLEQVLHGSPSAAQASGGRTAPSVEEL